MALIKCSECGKEISSNARSCPHCGNPTQNRKIDVDKEVSALKKVLIVGVIIFSIAIVGLLIGIFIQSHTYTSVENGVTKSEFKLFN